MRRRGDDDPEPDEDEEDEEPSSDLEGDDEEPSGPPRRRRPSIRFEEGVRPWQQRATGGRGKEVGRSGTSPQVEELDSEEETGPAGPLTRWRHRPVVPVFYRARDAWWFEPLVALALVILILVSLVAYTSNWPPVYVVESESMQHGSADQVGLINTGDLVLAQKVAAGQVVSYEQGDQRGYSTYGEYGDVLLFYPNGNQGSTPVIHRAILYLVYNATDGSFSAPALSGRPCNGAPGSVYSVTIGLSGCSATGMRGTLELFGIGWQNATVSVDLLQVGAASGFLTMGDNNYRAGSPATGEPDEPALTKLIEPGWVIGVARGMIPWFGSLKLALDGNTGEVPSQSWEYLALSSILIILGAVGIHFLLRAEGIEDERRKAADEEEGEESDDEEESPRRRLPWPIGGWRTRSDDEGEESDVDDELPSSEPQHRSSREHRERGGRPRPSVLPRRSRKGVASRKHRRGDREL